MAVHKFNVNGVVHRFEAPTKEAAEAELNRMMATTPKAFDSPGRRAALKQLLSEQNLRQRTETGFDRVTSRAANQMLLGVPDLAGGALRAGITGATNLGRRAFGAPTPYTAADMMAATRLYSDASRRQEFKDYPVQSVVGDVLGGVAMPGGKQVARFVVGKKAPALIRAGEKVTKAARTGQLARSSLAGAGLMGTQGVITSPTLADVPNRAQTGLITGAVAAPLMDVGLGVAGNLVKAGANMVAPYVGPAFSSAANAMAKSDVFTDTMRTLVGKYFPVKTAADRATEKVARRLTMAMQEEGLSIPEMDDALAEVSKSGGITPTVLDVLIKAKAGPKVLQVVSAMGRDDPTRRAAATYAEGIESGAQKQALDVTKRSFGQPAPTSQLKADVEATAQAARKPPPTATSREEGAAQVLDNLNAKRDELYTAYKEKFAGYDSGRPESVIVEDEQRAPLITAILSKSNIDDNSPAGKKLLKEITDLQEGYVGPPDAEGPQDTTRSRPLTVQALRNLEQRFGDIAQTELGNAKNQYLAAQKAIRDAMVDLADNGKLIGADPELIQNLGDGIRLFAQERDIFGEGLGAAITARKSATGPGTLGEPAVKPYQAADLIYGVGKTTRSLNDILADVEPLLPNMNPAAIRALQEELYTRTVGQNPETVNAEIAALAERFPTATSALLPPDLVTAAQAAGTQTTVAQAKAAGAQQAIDLGKQVLPSEAVPAADYVRDVEALTPSNRALQRSAGLQTLLTNLGTSAPENVGPFTEGLQGEEAAQKLGVTFGSGPAKTYQGRMMDVAQQVKNARTLERLTRGKLSNRDLPSEAAANIAYEKKGVQSFLQKVLGGLDVNNLPPEEAIALLRLLQQEGGVGKVILQPAQIKLGRSQTYPRIAPVTSQTLLGAVRPDEGDELERLKQEYGIDG